MLAEQALFVAGEGRYGGDAHGGAGRVERVEVGAGARFQCSEIERGAFLVDRRPELGFLAIDAREFAVAAPVGADQAAR